MSSENERELRARLDVIGQDLDGVLRSRWLPVLERLEVPVRIVRPGLGTVRVRLEAIRRMCRASEP